MRWGTLLALALAVLIMVYGVRTIFRFCAKRITSKVPGKILTTVASIALLLIVYGFVQHFLPVRLFLVQGPAMLPTFHSNELTLVNALYVAPKRTEIVVYHNPSNDAVQISRVIGLPGERVEIKKGDVYINGAVLNENPYWSDESVTHMTISLTLGSNEYFLLGDNRGIAFDSRTFGAVPEHLLIGTVLYPMR